jgi:hypothetical protein
MPTAVLVHHAQEALVLGVAVSLPARAQRSWAWSLRLFRRPRRSKMRRLPTPHDGWR